ncbi:hypothetical protein ALON55S_03228 [Alishewanella longhuensis]
MHSLIYFSYFSRQLSISLLFVLKAFLTHAFARSLWLSPRFLGSLAYSFSFNMTDIAMVKRSTPKAWAFVIYASRKRIWFEPWVRQIRWERIWTHFSAARRARTRDGSGTKRRERIWTHFSAAPKGLRVGCPKQSLTYRNANTAK